MGKRRNRLRRRWRQSRQDIADVLARIDTWPQRRLDEVLPHAWATADDQLVQ